MRAVQPRVLVISLAFAAVGLALYKNPRCQHGCRIFAEHLINQGIRKLI